MHKSLHVEVLFRRDGKRPEGGGIGGRLEIFPTMNKPLWRGMARKSKQNMCIMLLSNITMVLFPKKEVVIQTK
jgi:hypothetical protein